MKEFINMPISGDDHLITYRESKGIADFPHIIIELYITSKDICYLVNMVGEKKVLDENLSIEIFNLLNSTQISIFPKHLVYSFEGILKELDINRGDYQLKIQWGTEVPLEWKNLEKLRRHILNLFKSS